MLNSKLNNNNHAQNFKGKLILSGHLSKNFNKSIPELSEMIKNKPYDVFVRGSFYQDGKRRKIITRFHANSYGYMDRTDGLKYLDTYASKTRHGSYKTALQRLVNQMDEKIAKQKAKTKPKEPTFKEKFKNYMSNVLVRMFTE